MQENGIVDRIVGEDAKHFKVDWISLIGQFRCTVEYYDIKQPTLKAH